MISTNGPALPGRAPDDPPAVAAGPGRAHLVPLGPQHAAEILAGQDEALAAEVFGRWWEPETLKVFLERVDRWAPDGPLREFAALGRTGPPQDGRARPAVLIGGGGIHRLGAGLERGEAALSYWLLPAHRGRGLGRQVAGALVDLAREDPAIGRLVLRIAPGNAPSRALARSLGAHATDRRERHPGRGDRVTQRWELPLGTG